MSTPRNLGKEYPSVLDSAYKQHMSQRKVTEIMTRKIVTASPETTMEYAAKAMGEKHIGSLIVVKYDTPVGIVTERDLLSKVLARGREPREVKVEGEMSYPLMTLCSTATVKETAQTMIKKKGKLAVFECGNLLGIVTASDLVQSLPEAAETEVKVDDFMTKSVLTVDEKTSVFRVANTMGEKGIGSVVVTCKGEPMGIFTERDLLTTFLAKGRPLTMSVSESCTSPLITGQLGMSVHEAAHIMRLRHIRRLPIAKDSVLVGIITARDLVEAYAK